MNPTDPDATVVVATPYTLDLCVKLTGAPLHQPEREGSTAFVPERATWASTMRPEGLSWNVSLHGLDADGKPRCAVFMVDYDELPAWLPAPPSGWDDAVASPAYDAQAVA